jgi:hypothetical protein
MISNEQPTSGTPTTTVNSDADLEAGFEPDPFFPNMTSMDLSRTEVA